LGKERKARPVAKVFSPPRKMQNNKIQNKLEKSMRKNGNCLPQNQDRTTSEENEVRKEERKSETKEKKQEKCLGQHANCLTSNHEPTHSKEYKG